MRKIVFLIFIVFPFFAYPQLINGDFENIETINLGTSNEYEKPVNWCFGSHNPYGAELTTDSYSGNYAIKLWSWYFMQSNEEFYYGNSPFENGLPISNRPMKLNGFYKFINPNIQPNGITDSAYVSILLTKYNQTLNVRDTISLTEYTLGEQNSYSPFEIELNYLNNQIPDSIRVYFRTSYFQGSSDNTSECNYLYLDNLSLEGTMSISEQNQTKLVVYPNPAKDVVQIYSEQRIGKVKFYSIDGKMLDTREIRKFEQPISCDISNLSTGIYFMGILGINKNILNKVKIVKK